MKLNRPRPSEYRELIDGIGLGVSPHELARRIEKNAEGFSGAEGKERALTIAGTEMIRAVADRQLDNIIALDVAEVGITVRHGDCD